MLFIFKSFFMYWVMKKYDLIKSWQRKQEMGTHQYVIFTEINKLIYMC